MTYRAPVNITKAQVKMIYDRLEDPSAPTAMLLSEELIAAAPWVMVLVAVALGVYAGLCWIGSNYLG